MTLEDRRHRFNEVFKVKLNQKYFRDLYKGYGVTQQMPRARLGKPLLKHQWIQMRDLNVLKDTIKTLVMEGHEIIQTDECIFQADSKKVKLWAPVMDAH